jgi:hypothetical protein
MTKRNSFPGLRHAQFGLLVVPLWTAAACSGGDQLRGGIRTIRRGLHAFILATIALLSGRARRDASAGAVAYLATGARLRRIRRHAFIVATVAFRFGRARRDASAGAVAYLATGARARLSRCRIGCRDPAQQDGERSYDQSGPVPSILHRMIPLCEMPSSFVGNGPCARSISLLRRAAATVRANQLVETECPDCECCRRPFARQPRHRGSHVSCRTTTDVANDVWWMPPAPGIESHSVGYRRRQKTHCFSALQRKTRMAQSGRANRAEECPLSGVKRTPGAASRSSQYCR